MVRLPWIYLLLWTLAWTGVETVGPSSAAVTSSSLLVASCYPLTSQQEAWIGLAH